MPVCGRSHRTGDRQAGSEVRECRGRAAGRAGGTPGLRGGQAVAAQARHRIRRVVRIRGRRTGRGRGRGGAAGQGPVAGDVEAAGRGGFTPGPVSDADLAGTVVQAAGGLVLRDGPNGTREIALVHRPRYDDWTLPKGKLMPGESYEDGALREVHEETGLRCRLDRFLDRDRKSVV